MLLNNNSFRSASALGLLMVVASAAHAGSLAPQKANANTRTIDQGRRLLADRSARFIENKGQWNADARFLAKGKGLNLWFTDHGIRFDQRAGNRGQAVDMVFVGGHAARPLGSVKANASMDYFHGKTSVTHVAEYRELLTKNVLPGVSMRGYFEQGTPRYDLIVAPGTKPSAIQIGFRNANGLSIENGALRVGTHLGGFHNGKPFAYQTIDGKRVAVATNWKVSKAGTAGFKVGSYDASKPLVIDPLIYGTYYGGESGPDEIRSAATDPVTGGILVVGSSSAPDYPSTTRPFTDTLNPEGQDAFIARLTTDGTRADYSVLIGGQGTDVAQYLRIDANKDIWMVGTALTPTANGSQTTFPYTQLIGSDNSGSTNFFITRFTHTAAGDLSIGTTTDTSTPKASLVLATNDATKYMSGFDLASVGGTLEFAISGVTDTALPTSIVPNAGSVFASGNKRTGFLLRFTVDETTVPANFTVFSALSQYIGGTRRNELRGVALDLTGHAYVTGTVYKPSNPTSADPLNADTSNPSFAGLFTTTASPFSKSTFYTTGRLLRYNDAFVRIYDGGGTLTFSGILGGNGDDEAGGMTTTPTLGRRYTGSAIAIDGSDNVYVTGTIVNSPNFPRTPGTYGPGFSPTAGNQADIYVTKISPLGDQILLSTNLQVGSVTIGSGAQAYYAPSVTPTVLPGGIGVDDLGYVYITGNMRPNAINFPTTAGTPNEPASVALSTVPISPDALDSTYSSPTGPEYPTTEGFLTVLSPALDALQYGTYIGGSLDDTVYAPSFDSKFNVFVFGAVDNNRGYLRAGKTAPYNTQTTLNGFIGGLNGANPVKLNPNTSGGLRIDGSTFAYGLWGSPVGVNAPPFLSPNETIDIGRDGFVAQLDVGVVHPQFTGFTIAPATAGGGFGATATGTTTFTGTPSASDVVTYTITSGTDAASLDPLTSNASVPTSTKSVSAAGSVTIYTRAVSEATTVNVTATYHSTSFSTSFVVQPYLKDFTLSSGTVLGGSSNTITGTIAFNVAATDAVQKAITITQGTVVGTSPVTIGALTYSTDKTKATFPITTARTSTVVNVPITVTLHDPIKPLDVSITQGLNVGVFPVNIVTLTPIQRTIRSGTGSLDLNAYFDTPTVAGGVVVVSFSVNGIFVGATTRTVGAGYSSTVPFPIHFSTNRLTRNVNVSIVATYYPSGSTSGSSSTATTFVTVSR